MEVSNENSKRWDESISEVKHYTQNESISEVKRYTQKL